MVTLNGTTGTVAWVHTVSGQADMYNLTVANAHTYAVGSGQWVVQNVGGVEPEDLIPLGDIRFTQAFIGERFGSGYSFEQTLASMRTGTMTP